MLLSANLHHFLRISLVIQHDKYTCNKTGRILEFRDLTQLQLSTQQSTGIVYRFSSVQLYHIPNKSVHCIIMRQSSMPVVTGHCQCDCILRLIAKTNVQFVKVHFSTDQAAQALIRHNVLVSRGAHDDALSCSDA